MDICEGGGGNCLTDALFSDAHFLNWVLHLALARPHHAANFLCWGVLLVVYRPWTKTSEVRPLKRNTDPMTGTQVRVCVWGGGLLQQGGSERVGQESSALHL